MRMVPRDPLWWLHSCILRLRILSDRRGVQFLSGEACLERTLCATVEVRKGARVLWIARYVDEAYSYLRRARRAFLGGERSQIRPLLSNAS